MHKTRSASRTPWTAARLTLRQGELALTADVAIFVL
jgi:hypothetical protein